MRLEGLEKLDLLDHQVGWVLLVLLEQLVRKVLLALRVHLVLADFLAALDSQAIPALAVEVVIRVLQAIQVRLGLLERLAHLAGQVALV